MAKKEDTENTTINGENKFEKKQPLRHPLTKVVIDEESKKYELVIKFIKF